MPWGEGQRRQTFRWGSVSPECRWGSIRCGEEPERGLGLQELGHDAPVSGSGFLQLVDFDVFVHGVGQILPGGAEAYGGYLGLAGIVAAVGAERIGGDIGIESRRRSPLSALTTKSEHSG